VKDNEELSGQTHYCKSWITLIYCFLFMQPTKWAYNISYFPIAEDRDCTKY